MLDQFEEKEVYIRRSKGSGRKVTYGYYSVVIVDKNGEPLVLSVRVDKKRKNIGDDDSYQVFGMAADIPDELHEKQIRSYTENYPVADIILNDVSDMQSLPRTIIFAIAALLSLAVTVKIILNSINAE